ncbi:hypothetical protein J132_06877 [Termitomyces sp. J132]|nr:hypothetical protein J132_06877 [Termitomyces sp. J132]
MATVVERPMASLSDTQVLPRHQPQQRRSSVVEVEIIDVDQLDDMPSTSTFLGTRHPREVIVIDSDDETVTPTQASGSTPTASRRRRLISPPPPTPEPIQRPPVPPVPHRFAVLAGFPVNPTLDAGTPPVIRPIERNFNLGGMPPPLSTTAVPAHPNRHRRPPIVGPRAEPGPHHLPALGLGGAIIALNDQGPRLNNNRDRNHRRYLHNHIANDEQQPGFIDRGFNALRTLYTTFARSSADDDAFFPFEPINAVAVAAAQPAGVAFQEALFRRRRPEEAKYKVEYTHPHPPEPGYTFNFAPPELSPPKPRPVVIDLVGSDSEDGPAGGPSKLSAPASPAASVRELLVCAKCFDPLVLGGDLLGDEGRRRKVWALRCGHMIDGKCLDILGVPEQENRQEQSFSGKGKGKAKANDGASTFTSTEVFAAAENTVRSRLRSRVPPPPAPMMPTTTTTTILGKRKRSTKPRIEATHEWKCPVESCGRIHASVKIDGVWIPEPDKGPTGGKGKGKTVPLPASLEAVISGRGAIAVFV